MRRSNFFVIDDDDDIFLQVVETVLKICPEDGARLFSSMSVDILQAVLEPEVQ
jgi:hypothetical protein